MDVCVPPCLYSVFERTYSLLTLPGGGGEAGYLRVLSLPRNGTIFRFGESFPYEALNVGDSLTDSRVYYYGKLYFNGEDGFSYENCGSVTNTCVYSSLNLDVVQLSSEPRLEVFSDRLFALEGFTKIEFRVLDFDNGTYLIGLEIGVKNDGRRGGISIWGDISTLQRLDSVLNCESRYISLGVCKLVRLVGYPKDLNNLEYYFYKDGSVYNETQSVLVKVFQGIDGEWVDGVFGFGEKDRGEISVETGDKLLNGGSNEILVGLIFVSIGLGFSTCLSCMMGIFGLLIYNLVRTKNK